MKRLAVILLFAAASPGLSAQPYGNEWINHAQQYYKFPVYEDGIYRMDYVTLSAAGIPVNTIDPRSFQVFGRGQEQYIFVSGEADGVFNNGDYIELYAQKNDGWYDTVLYKNGEVQPNPRYSLFTDTAWYFITWNASVINSRMTEETAVNFGSYSPAAWFMKEEFAGYTSAYYHGPLDGRKSSDAEYKTGEGWLDSELSLGATSTRQIPTDKVYAAGPDAQVSIVMTGASATSHHIRIELPGDTIDTIYWGYVLRRFDRSLPASAFPSALSPFVFRSVNDQGASGGRDALSWISVKYPHTPDMEGKSAFSLFVPDDAQGKTHLRLTNFNNKGGAAWLYDVSNHRRITVLKNGSDFQALVPNSGGEKECLLVAAADIRIVPKVYPATFSLKFADYLNNVKDYDYLIITGPALWIDAGLYRQYRTSLEGDSFKVLVVNVEELYDQFSYGVKKHPQAIRNFLDLALDNWFVKPEYLLLLGKAVTAHSESSMPGYRKDKNAWKACIVPSFGNPPSDNLFSNGLGSSILYEHGVRTGRVAATGSQEAQLYLDKVKSYEAQQPAEWMKNVLHFSGGGDSGEGAIFKAHVNEYKQTLEGIYFGAKVHTFSKSSPDPIQVNLSDSVRNLINNGVSIMTFFGHATSSGFDQNVDSPEKFSNKDRYPLIVANSCFAGNIHMYSGGSVSEQWIFTKDGGAIAFLAQVGLGMETYTHAYSKSFFESLGVNYYGERIGRIMQESERAVQSVSWPVKATVLEMTLHGDPALIINSHSKPDYVITEPFVYYTPSVISNELDSFSIHLVMRNIGKAIADSFVVEVVRTLPNGQVDAIKTQYAKAPTYRDTVSFTFAVDRINGIGINKFSIALDALDEIGEIDDLENNYLTTELLIRSSDIIPVHPYEFAVIPGPGVTLTASTSDPLAPAKDYVFQIDTTDRFNSPLLLQQTVNHAGGVVPWTPPLNMPDSTVYFWRVSPDSLTAGSYTWRNSSFQYIPGKRGWGQAHYYQFRKDSYTYIDYNEPQRQFDFVLNAGALLCRTKGAANWGPWPHDYLINGTVTEYGACTAAPSVHVAVIDSLSLEPWNTLTHQQFGNVNKLGVCPGRGTRPENYFIFRSNDASQLDAMLTMLQQVPDGHYVLVYTVFGGNFSLWKPALMTELKAMGAAVVDTLKDDQPYIFFVKKGDLSTAADTAGKNNMSEIDLNVLLTGVWNYGDVTSTLIGPATSWGSFHYRHHPFEPGTKDSVNLQIRGIKYDGTEVTVIDTLPVDSIFLLPVISATDYPYLELKAFLLDDTMRTPSQIDRWQVIYDEAPEAAIDPSAYYSFRSDTVAEGDVLSVDVVARNIGGINMSDSLLVKYWIMDKSRNRHSFPSFRVKRLLAGDTVMLRFAVNTLGIGGPAEFWAEINPVNDATGRYDQIEQHHFNNIMQVSFYIGEDRINPMLDVTFDGMHILNGEIVSARPDIFIRLKDENKFLALNDTSLFEIYLLRPGVYEAERVFFIADGQAVMQWTPAGLPDNTFEINYRPVLTEDGTYELLVRATDVSRNISGNGDGWYDYRIGFEVVNKSTITQVVNYPNPFSTSTRFVFTLTGSEVPDQFHIQILTVSGRVVREISGDELGPLRVGRNITQYAWDGTDEFGGRLANGIYLYRVLTRLNGSDIEHRETAADKYFTSGFGKMYLMR